MDPISSLSRRAVLAGSAGAAAVVGSASPGRAARDPFLHGVASGDPLPRAVVLWTRVTPTSDATPGSGRGPRITVTWEVATDRRFRESIAAMQAAGTSPREAAEEARKILAAMEMLERSAAARAEAASAGRSR